MNIESNFVCKVCYRHTESINSSVIKLLFLPVLTEDILPAESTFLSFHLSDLPIFLNFAPSLSVSSVILIKC